MPAKKTVKRTVTTKTPKKKPAPSKKKPPAKSGTTAAGPAGELRALMKELNDEEISWLVTQARTIIYNHKVVEANQAAKELVEAKNRHSGSASAAAKKKTSESRTVDIEPTPNGKNFIMIVGNKRLFLNLDELKALVRISQVTDDPRDAAGRLFRWMEKERGDMINTAGFSGPADPRLAAVFAVLRNRYTVG